MKIGFAGTILAASLGFGLVQLDVSIVNVALVSIGRDLNAGIASVAWIVGAYTIAFACMLLPGGALGDRIGAKRSFLGGFAVFGLASLGCALAPSIGFLIVLRVVQGIGASTLVPCSLALIAHAARDDGKLRARGIALWTAAGSVSLAAGPILGGALIAGAGWRAIFFINLPLCAAAIVLGLRLSEETPARGGNFDPLGELFAVVTLLSAIAGVIEAGALGFGAGFVRIALLTSVIGAAGFVVVELRVRDPMVPLSFFGLATFRAAVGVGFAINATLYGTLFMLALYLQHARHYTPLMVGLAFMPFAAMLGIANLAAGMVVGKRGPRGPMLAGLAVALAGFALLCGYSAHSSYIALLPALLVIPSGIGVAVPAMTSALLGVTPRERSGIASGVLNSVRQAAGALGIALAAALIVRLGPVAGFHLLAELWSAMIGIALVVALLGITRAPRRTAS
jgi:DHA2 family methylenomycin A resistance protein-like MFS transporter